jgi:hypothetical protein
MDDQEQHNEQLEKLDPKSLRGFKARLQELLQRRQQQAEKPRT